MTTDIDADACWFIIVVGELYEFPLFLANIHAPNWDDANFFSDVYACLPNMVSHNIIFGWEHNPFLFSYRSSLMDKPISKTVHIIQYFLDHFGLADICRFRNSTARKYSFFSNVHKTFSLISYFFLDKKKSYLGLKTAMTISDHSPLSFYTHS